MISICSSDLLCLTGGFQLLYIQLTLILVSLTSLSKVAMIQAPRPSPLLAQAEPALPIFSTLSKAFLQDQLGAREEEEVQVMALGFTFLGAWQSEVLVWVEGVEVSATACTSSMATGVPAVVVCWARIWDQVSGACRPPAQLTSAREARRARVLPATSEWLPCRLVRAEVELLMAATSFTTSSSSSSVLSCVR